MRSEDHTPLLAQAGMANSGAAQGRHAARSRYTVCGLWLTGLLTKTCPTGRTDVFGSSAGLQSLKAEKIPVSYPGSKMIPHAGFAKGSTW